MPRNPGTRLPRSGALPCPGAAEQPGPACRPSTRPSLTQKAGLPRRTRAGRRVLDRSAWGWRRESGCKLLNGWAPNPTRLLAYQTRQSATSADRLISGVTVTDPRHPLYGQRLAVLSLACARGPHFIAVALPDGRRRLIPRSATDLERPTSMDLPVPKVSARMLLPLARHVRGLATASSTEIVHAVPPSRSCTPTSTNTAPSAPKAAAAMAGAAAASTDAAGPAARPPAAARRRGGASC